MLDYFADPVREFRAGTALEIRGAPYKKKTFLLGCKGSIVARCEFGEPIHIKTVAQWNKLRPQHRVPGTKKLPYKKTFGLPVQRLTQFQSPYEYRRCLYGPQRESCK